MVKIHEKRYRNWVHGSDTNVEKPDEIEELDRTGTGTTVRQDSGTSNIFHFAIPTPTEINNVPTVEIEEAYLHAQLNDAGIDGVTVYEGGTDIFNQETNFQSSELKRTFDINDTRIQSAINLAIEVNFFGPGRLEVDEPNPIVQFIAAGAQFNAYTQVGPDRDVSVEPGRVVGGTITFSTER